jgi:hypothetical protein
VRDCRRKHFAVGLGASLLGGRFMFIDLPAARDGEVQTTAAETKSAQRVWIETTLTALFATASVLLVSFVAVIRAVV